MSLALLAVHHGGGIGGAPVSLELTVGGVRTQAGVTLAIQ